MVGHGARCNDEEVVCEVGAAAHQLVLKVDAVHLVQPHVRVAVTAQDAAHRMGDLGRIEQPGGNLVQQRLEEVVVVPVDDQHVSVRRAQRARRTESAEAGADDDHARPRQSGTSVIGSTRVP